MFDRRINVFGSTPGQRQSFEEPSRLVVVLEPQGLDSRCARWVVMDDCVEKWHGVDREEFWHVDGSVLDREVLAELVMSFEPFTTVSSSTRVSSMQCVTQGVRGDTTCSSMRTKRWSRGSRTPRF